MAKQYHRIAYFLYYKLQVDSGNTNCLLRTETTTKSIKEQGMVVYNEHGMVMYMYKEQGMVRNIFN